MPRHTVGQRSTGAGSATLPLFSLYAGASAQAALRELGVFNTTATAVAVALVRLASSGQPGAAVTIAPNDTGFVAAQAAAYGTHTSAPTLGTDLGYRAPLGAAVGAGVIWTFGDRGLVIPKGSTNGIGLYVPTGTGQVVDWYLVFDE